MIIHLLKFWYNFLNVFLKYGAEYGAFLAHLAIKFEAKIQVPSKGLVFSVHYINITSPSSLSNFLNFMVFGRR